MTNQKTPIENTEHSLGLAGGVAKMFITSPLALLLLIAFLALGMLGMQMTPRQEDPQISVPMMDIFVAYPGATAAEVESQVARPLEGIMSEITGVKHVYSASSRGQALVTVQFKVGENFESSKVKLNDKLASNKNRMPKGIAGFRVEPVGVDDVPVVAITLWSNNVDDASLKLVSLDLLQKLREIPNVSKSFIVDGRTDQLLIEILPERLATYGVSLGQIANTIRMANSEREAGSVEPGDKFIKVITGSFLKSAEDIKRLMVAVVDGRPVYVRDVATVSAGPSEASKIVGYYTGKAGKQEGVEIANGAPAVTLAIAKKHGTNGVDVAEAVLERVEHFKGRLIPDNVHVAVTRNYGASAKAKVNELLFKLGEATLMVTVLVLFFLGWRASLVTFIIIPVVITVTVFSAWLLGLTIDRVSLFALIFSIGILVDDAIVVVENIYRRWLMSGSLDVDVAVDAVREVGNPTILATFTVIAALLPMGFVSGMMGPYMSPIPILGSVAMIFSLFAAFAFTPWLTNRLKPSLKQLDKMEVKEHKQAAMLEKFFRGIIVPLIQNRKKGKLLIYGLVGVLLMTLILFYTKGVKVKMLPLDNKPEFNIVVNFPEGTALPLTANLINQIATTMQSVDEVTAVQTYAGTASPFNFNGLVRHYYLRKNPWQGDVQVQLTDKHDRDRSSHEIAEEARDVLTPIAKALGAKIQVVEMPPGPPVLQSVVAEIYGPSAETRRQVARDITKIFEEAPNLGDVDNFLEDAHDILRFKVDTAKAQRNGITVEDINSTLEMAMGGFVLGDIKRNALINPTPIIMQVPLSARSQINRLIQLPVTNRMGKTMPLSELGNFVTEKADQPIYHKDLRAVEFVTGETVGDLAAPVYGMFQVQDLLSEANNGDGYKAPDGTIVTGGNWFGRADTADKTNFEWGGEWTVTFETFRDMGIAFMAALILIYMLIVGLFGNFVLPAIAIAPIPLTLIGIIPGHWLWGADFTATSMIGFIALAGIVVRNSILLIDFTRNAVLDEGMSVIDAAIYSCEARTRPIAITAFALIGGSLVIITDPIFKGMAVSLVFGGLLSTLLTLIVVPLGCISAGKALCVDGDGNSIVPPDFDPDKEKPTAQTSHDSSDSGESLSGKVKDAGSTALGIVATVSGLLLSGVKGLFGLVFNRKSDDEDDWKPSPATSKKANKVTDTNDEWVPSPRKPRKAKKKDDKEWVPSPRKPRKSSKVETKPVKAVSSAAAKSKPSSDEWVPSPRKPRKSKLLAEKKVAEEKIASSKSKVNKSKTSSTNKKLVTKAKAKPKAKPKVVAKPKAIKKEIAKKATSSKPKTKAKVVTKPKVKSKAAKTAPKKAALITARKAKLEDNAITKKPFKSKRRGIRLKKDL
ncbi:MAG: efflux RND transporter permease subunit [Cocleimonas sp.]